MSLLVMFGFYCRNGLLVREWGCHVDIRDYPALGLGWLPCLFGWVQWGLAVCLEVSC